MFTSVSNKTIPHQWGKESRTKRPRVEPEPSSNDPFQHIRYNRQNLSLNIFCNGIPSKTRQ